MNADKLASLVARVGELPHGALASRPQTLTRWRVSYTDKARRVVWAADEADAMRQGRRLRACDIVNVRSA